MTAALTDWGVSDWVDPDGTTGLAFDLLMGRVGIVFSQSETPAPEPQPAPLTLSLRDFGHTATVPDTGHTSTVRDHGHTATVRNR